VKVAAAGLLLVSLVATTPVMADRADREKEIVIVADKSLADDAKRTINFEGNVVVSQGTMRITATKVTMREDKDRHKFYVAQGGPVTFRQKRDKVDEWIEGFAERAEFDDRDDVLKLFNRAKVVSSQNEITGDFISYDMRRELAVVTGGPPGTTPPANSRVKVIITPPKKSAPGKEEPAREGLNLKPDKSIK
jgi:lipopolysaccharide export system protein LptA